MSTSVLNTAAAATAAASQTTSPATESSVPSGPSNSSSTSSSSSSTTSSSSSTHNSNMESTTQSSNSNSSTNQQGQSQTASTPPNSNTNNTTMVGAPTSVVVTVPHNISQQQSSHTQPSTSGGSAPSASSASTSSPNSGPSTSQIHYVSDSLIQPLFLAAAAASQHHQAHAQVTWISSTASTQAVAGSSGSQQSTSSNQAPTTASLDSELMKRSLELFDTEKSYEHNQNCNNGKRAKTVSCLHNSPCNCSASSSAKEEALSIKQKLEQRLNGILCCAVCLDLPKSSVYQCQNGHLMCAGCFTHVLADARLRDEAATCPSCRISISKDNCSRNLAVEKAVCELSGECRFCQRELPRSILEKHMSDICEERIVPCKYSNIGCPWNGPFHEADYHAASCIHPNKSAREVFVHLERQESKKREQRKVYETLFSLLSYEKIAIQDAQLRPYRTDEYIHKLFYETSRFTAFNLQWVIKAKVNDDQRDPTQSCKRNLSFQLCLKSKINNPMTIHYMLIKGPYGETKVLPMIYKFDFTETQTESSYNFINLAAATADSNRLLAARIINFRLIMFQASK